MKLQALRDVPRVPRECFILGVAEPLSYDVFGEFYIAQRDVRGRKGGAGFQTDEGAGRIEVISRVVRLVVRWRIAAHVGMPAAHERVRQQERRVDLTHIV